MSIHNFKLIISFILFSIILTSSIYCQENTNSTDSIAIINKKNGKEIRGMVISNNSQRIIIESGNNQQIIIPYSDIASVEFISTEEIKRKKEFENDNLNYSQHCFLPTAFTTHKGEFTRNSHYLASYNFKYGISDHFEISAGSVFFTTYFFSVGYSNEIADFLKFSINTYGGYLWIINGTEFVAGYGIIPRISIGNENRSITMGFIHGAGWDFLDWIYGGYIAGKRKIRERWSISGELSGLTIDGNYLLYLGDITIDFLRTSNTSWSFGIAGINFNDPYIDIPFIPLPYVGYLKRF